MLKIYNFAKVNTRYFVIKDLVPYVFVVICDFHLDVYILFIVSKFKLIVICCEYLSPESRWKPDPAERKASNYRWGCRKVLANPL